MDYRTLNDLINAQGPSVTSGGGYNVDATGGEGGGGPSYYVEPWTNTEYSVYKDDKGYIRDPDTGAIREFYLKEPERKFNDEAQSSGYYTNVYNPDGTVSKVFNRQKGNWEKTKPLVAAIAGLGTLGYGLGALGAAGAGAGAGAAGAGAAGAGGFGITPEAIASLYGTEVAGTGGIASLGGTELAGPLIDSTIPASYGTTVPGVASGTAAAGGAGTAAAGAAGKTLADKLTDPKLWASLAAGLGTAAATKRSNEKIAQKGFTGGIDPNRLAFNRDTGEYTVRATGQKYAAGGGIAGLAPNEYKAGGRYLSGPGDGMSDNIKANIDGHQEARLADGEFVIPADVVSHIGNGSSNAGAKKLHDMMNRIRHARTGNPKQGKQIKPEKYLPA